MVLYKSQSNTAKLSLHSTTPAFLLSNHSHMSKANTLPISTRKNIREQVYDLLRARMRLGEIGFEDRLVDHEIAAELNVSRMPVREAMMQLKSEGLLEGTSRGFMLRQFTPTDIAQIFEIRLLLEPEAAMQASKNTTLEKLTLMSTYAKATEHAHQNNDPLAYMEANDHFRASWLNMTPNSHLRETIQRLSNHVEAVRLATLREAKYRTLSWQYTQELLQGFIEENPEKVAQAIRSNLRAAALSYYATLDDLLENPTQWTKRKMFAHRAVLFAHAPTEYDAENIKKT